MKKIVTDILSKHEEEVRGSTLNVKTYPLSMIEEDDLDTMMEEAHYVHTMNAFVELIVLYGWDKVTTDLRAAMGEKKW